VNPNIITGLDENDELLDKPTKNPDDLPDTVIGVVALAILIVIIIGSFL